MRESYSRLRMDHVHDIKMVALGPQKFGMASPRAKCTGCIRFPQAPQDASSCSGLAHCGECQVRVRGFYGCVHSQGQNSEQRRVFVGIPLIYSQCDGTVFDDSHPRCSMVKKIADPTESGLHYFYKARHSHGICCMTV